MRTLIPHRARCVGLLLLSGALLTGPGVVRSQGSPLPVLGDDGGAELTVGAERRWGERIMQEIRRDPDLIDDPVLLSYVSDLWSGLVLAAKQRGELSSDQDTHLAFEAFLIRDRSVNAMALPGGYVGVHLGLISMTASADELAAVLAHELSHVTQRHIARSMASSRRQSLVGLTALFLGVLAAARTNSVDMANAAVIGSQAALAQGQLNFSRDMEREADRVGYGVLDQAGFAPAAMSTMFDKLLQASRLNDQQQYPYLRTHPLTTERIGEARARLAAAAAADPRRRMVSPWLHAAMQARARALMDPRAVAQQRLMQLGAAVSQPSSIDLLVALWAGTQAALQARDWAVFDAGLQRLEPAAQAHPELARPLAWLTAEGLLERGRSTEAQAMLKRWSDGSREAVFLEAKAAVATGRDLAASAEALQARVVTQPGDASAWGWLSRLQEQRGERIAALRSQAEQQAALGDVPGAIDRLRAAQKQARSLRAADMDAAIVEARLRQLEVRHRQDLLDAREGKGPR